MCGCGVVAAAVADVTNLNPAGWLWLRRRWRSTSGTELLSVKVASVAVAWRRRTSVSVGGVLPRNVDM